MAAEVSPLRRLASAAAVLTVSVALVQSLPGGGAAAETAASAQQEATRLQAELTDYREHSASAIVALEQAENTLGVAIGQASRLAEELERAQDDAGGTDRQLSRRVSALYRAGGTVGLWASVLDAENPADLAARKVNLDKIVATDARVRAVAQDDAGRVAAVEEQARKAAAEQVRAAGVAQAQTAELEDLVAAQQVALDRASATVLELLEQERRAAAAAAAAELAAEQAAAQAAEQKARVAAALAAGQSVEVTVGSAPGVGRSAGGAPSSGGGQVAAGASDTYYGPAGVCPVGQAHSFTDTWGAPRSGGRKHKGSDVFAPFGSPAFAVVDGVIDKQSNGGLGGLAVWLRGDDGTRYYYAHNASNVAQVGQRVQAGQVIAYVGNTGNAATTPPHIHFEAHPGGNGARNPAPWLKALCGG